jgi:hypothetical protein
MSEPSHAAHAIATATQSVLGRARYSCGDRVTDSDAILDVLARCHGYLAVASDGPVGEIETPLFPPGADEPDYLIIRLARVLRPRMPVIWGGLVQEIDAERRLVFLDATREEIRHQPEHLPLAV